MISITDPISIIVLIFVLMVALIIFATIKIRKSKQKKDQQINDAFGKIPNNNDEDIDKIDAYHIYYSSSIHNDKRIDKTTWNDLNMDDVFKRINNCSSSVGEEYLYHILHELIHDECSLQRREKVIRWFSSHTKERLAVQKLLLGIGKHQNNGLSYYIFNAATKKIKHSWLFLIMAILPVAGIILTPFLIIPGLILTMASAGANIAVYYFVCIKIENELENMRYFTSLLFGAKKLQKKMGKELKQYGFDLENSLKPFKRLGGLIPGNVKQSLSELEAFIILFKAIFLVDLVLYNNTINAMLKHIKKLSELYKIIGEIDVAICVASFRHSLKHYCLPVFHNEKSIVFKDMFHPLIREPVVNGGEICNDSIITGSNASGKSTFIKGIAVNNILAQTIHTCCAKQYKMKLSYVATSMALRDNIVSGDSYFIAEIKSLKRIVEFAKNQYCTCFIDEILRGTNTHERIAASTAVLKLLHETGSLCVVASHDIELTEILKDIYDNYHFCEKIIDNAIEFDYLLKSGPSRTTNAIKLLEYMGFDKRVVDEAVALLKE
ncbi:MAG: hypothetical protein R2876_04765 [Eubacteriales bacterium]